MREIKRFINKDEIIKQIPLFSELSWIDTWIVLPKLSFFEYDKGEVIFKENGIPEAFYFLLSGRIQLYKRLYSGEQKILEYLGRGKYVGITSLLTAEPYSVSARVINDAYILKIDKADFDYILKRIPKLAVKMSKYLSRILVKKNLKGQDTFDTKLISIIGALDNSGRGMYAKNLAFSLKNETNKKVILLDMNGKKSSIFQKLGIKIPVSVKDITIPSFNEQAIKKAVIKHRLGIDLLCINYARHQGYGKTNTSDLLSILIDDYSYIVIYPPSGLDHTIKDLIRQSDLLHILTNRKNNNLKASKTLIDEIKASNNDVPDNMSVIINQTEITNPRFSNKRLSGALGKIYANIPYFVRPAAKKDGSVEILEFPETKYARSIRSIAREIGEVRIGLALSGGAAFGLAQIGVIKVLEEKNIPVDVVSGSSIGAFIGALWVSGVSGREIEKIALQLENKLRVIRLFDFAFPRRGLASGRYITKMLNKNLKCRKFQDLKIPLKIVACDLESRQDVIFEEGSIARAVRASIAIPGVFAPLFDKGKFLIDGGILQPLPMQPLLRAGVDKIIAVNTFPNQLDIKKGYQKYQERLVKEVQEIRKAKIAAKLFYKLKKIIRRLFIPNIFDAIVIATQASESVLAEMSGRDADVYFHPDLSEINWFEFYKARELIKRGEDEARRLIPQLEKLFAVKENG